jgi:1,2-phenylacetyl-CoA epoxidase catalytic subunit
MDDQQQQRVNQAAEEFANALRESYQTVAERGESGQQLNAEMTQQFFNSVINHLQSHAEANVQAGDELLSQAQRGQEASQQLTQESVQAYMGFINSMFSFSQAGPEVARRGTERAT